jgi:hypothetical protein
MFSFPCNEDLSKRAAAPHGAGPDLDLGLGYAALATQCAARRGAGLSAAVLSLPQHENVAQNGGRSGQATTDELEAACQQFARNDWNHGS